MLCKDVMKLFFFDAHVFLQSLKNVNMAVNEQIHCGLTPETCNDCSLLLVALSRRSQWASCWYTCCHHSHVSSPK